MKDWQKSPEPPSMMGAPHYASEDYSIPPSPKTPIPSDEAGPSCPRRTRTKVDVSLGEMSRRVIMQRLHMYDTFGSTPFPIVRTILENCTAKKLLALEEESPHFLCHTDYIWKRLCIKDFKDIAQAVQSGTLEEVDDWRALHVMKQAMQQEALEAAAARVKEKYASLQADRDAHRVRVVAATSPNKHGLKPPRSKPISIGNLTTGQKLLRDARKQGNARLHMTQGVRKSAPPLSPLSPSSTFKRPRLESTEMTMPKARIEGTSRDADQPSVSQTSASRRITTGNPLSNIFITTKRRIPNGIPQSRRM